MSVSYNANNQQVGGSYDANGNTSSANGSAIGYTVENKMNSQVSNTWPFGESLYGYDPWGKRVMKETNPDPQGLEGENNPLWEFYFYSITGQRLATMDCNNPNGNPIPSCWVVGENVYFKQKTLVSNGVYVVTDRLGSVRGNTQGESMAYYPYGEERTSTVNGRDKFATYFRDGVGQDYADQRYYGSGTGRFWSADQGGIRTANPASWNRYAYVQGDPVNFADPRGAYLVDAGGGLFLDCGYGADSIYDGTCTGTDGGWGGDGGGGCGSSMGSGFMEAPDPNPCPVNYDGPPAPPPSVSLREISACTEAHGKQTGNFTLDITYQVMVNGAAVTSNLQLFNLGIYFVSEKLTNPTGDMGTSGAAWCLGMASAMCPYSGDVGLLSYGVFVDELSGQGTLTQSFYQNGTGSPLNVAFGPLSFVGPLQSYTMLNNTYNSRGRPYSVTVAGGAFSSVGAPPCK
jgi:RHS repeat-associated protein